MEQSERGATRTKDPNMPQLCPFQVTLITGITLALVAGLSGVEPEWVQPFENLVFSAPAATSFCRIDPEGISVIPNGRLLTPRGHQIVVEPHPYGLVLSADGRTLITANSGTEPFSFSIVREPLSAAPQLQSIPEGVKTDAGVLSACFMGLAIPQQAGRPIFYAAGGDDGTVMIWNLETRQREQTISLNQEFRGRAWADSYAGDLVLALDEKYLHVVDQMNFRVVTLDLEREEIVDVIPVGRYPFGLCLSPDGQRLFVANIGMFEYSVIEGFDPTRFEETGLTFPPFAYLSEEMKSGTVSEGKQVPGLGDPNVPESVSVYTLDVSVPGESKVIARTKTGVLVGERVEGVPALGGSAPNSIVANQRHVFVSNGRNDSITVLDIATQQRLRDVVIRLPAPLDRLRGIIPFGLAISSDGKRLYVAEAGINAVGVIDTETFTVLGHIPVGWFPSQPALSPDGQTLVVANAKGFGSGPNGGPGIDLGGRSGIGNLMRGTVSILPTPTGDQLSSETAQVLLNNFHRSRTRPWDGAERNPIPPYPGAYESPIKYTVFIAKENRTYDQVYGQLRGGRGEPTLADYGIDVTVESRSRPDDRVERVNVMPNHQRLARQFASCDNFYCDSDHSADGHRWLQGVYPGVFCETSTSASYGGARRHLIASTAQGRRVVTGSAAGLLPEDYLESGSMWDHFDRCGVSFFNFGLGFEMPAVAEGPGGDYKLTGIRIASNYPIPAPLMERTSRRFATYNTNIPDQFRVDMFELDLKERWLSGSEPFPQMITMSLPNDHGAGERPDDGYPYFASYMADNDLALARLLDVLSQTPYWKEMAVFITEDDAQNGRDHVDAHRSFCLVVSPYAKRSYVSHVHTSIPSILKTINLIHGMPYINQYDAMASDLSDLFQATPDYTPYTAVKVDARLFNLDRAYDPLDEEFNWDAVNDFPALDHPDVLKRWMDEDAKRRSE
jgi:YVTN family beta-propeller protein